MCARYLLRNDAEAVAKVFEAQLRYPDYEPRYNVAPTDTMPVVRFGDAGMTVDGLRWGFRARWTKAPLINARDDKLFESRTWAGAAETRRCIVPAEGFYEWEDDPSGKLPWLITREDAELMWFAGVWQRGEAPAYSIVTCDPAGALGTLHDRIPVILDRDQAGVWLDPETPAEVIRGMLAPLRREQLALRAVSTKVNSVRNDVPEVLEDRLVQQKLI